MQKKPSFPFFWRRRALASEFAPDTVSVTNLALSAAPGSSGITEDVSPGVGPEFIRKISIEVLEERLNLLGVDRSGAYAHYKLLLDRGLPIPTYEIAIMEFVRERLSRLCSYHEIGSGLGTLTFILADAGFAAVGVERDQPRHLTSTAILQPLARQAPHIESNCRLIGAPFPDAVADIDVSDSLAILTDFVSTQTPEEFALLCRGLARYRYVLMDLKRFCIKRETREDQQQLVRQLAYYGLTPCSDPFDFGSDTSYCLFESNPAADLCYERGKARTPVRPDTEPHLPNPQPQDLPAQLPVSAPDAESEITLLAPRPQRVKRKRFGGLVALSALLVIGIPSLVSTVYYGLVAANQYVTTFEFAVRGRELPAVPVPSAFSRE